jgi:hypothetical protein
LPHAVEADIAALLGMAASTTPLKACETLARLFVHKTNLLLDSFYGLRAQSFNTVHPIKRHQHASSGGNGLPPIWARTDRHFRDVRRTVFIYSYYPDGTSAIYWNSGRDIHDIKDKR